MNKTQQLANEKFSGNINEAIKYIMFNIRGEELGQYIDEWTPEQARFALDSVYQVGEEKLGKDGLQKIVKEEVLLDELNLTKDEVMNAQKNPFGAKIAKGLLKLFIVNGGIVALGTLLSSLGMQNSQGIIQAAAVGGASIFTTYMATDIGVDIVKFFKYKKIKKSLNEDYNKNKENDLTEGKML